MYNLPCIHSLTAFAQALGTEKRLENISTAILIQSFEIEYSRLHIDQTGLKLRSVVYMGIGIKHVSDCILNIT